MESLVECLTGGGGGEEETGEFKEFKGEYGVVTYKDERSMRSSSEGEETFAGEESKEDGETGLSLSWKASGRMKSEKGIEIVDCGM